MVAGPDRLRRSPLLSEAKAKLSRYAQLCRDEPVIVTINGVPAFRLVPFEEDDDLIDRILEYNPKFRQMLKRRLREKSVSAKDAMSRI